MANKHHALLVALFDDRDKAEAAMRALQQWEKAPDSVKVGALCVISKSAEGHLQYHRANILDVGHGVRFGLIAGAVIGGLIALPLGAGLAAAAAAGGTVALSGITVGSAAAATGTGIAAGVTGATAGGAAGGAVGAAAGAVESWLWGFKHADLERIGNHLDDGKAALLVLVEEAAVDATKAELTRLGGVVESYAVPAEALDHADAALATPPPNAS
ncbi:MAG: hypothetical protein ACRDJE_07515 [Dehalococcoidia bacterium]